ncbi:uncharacterized protein LOC106087001 [Stomoxys calcitrans]|uniref:uncharacterized protein LOC106087001 n=1 Tax=Stomoxys calcitrans TaxID=35570 RepID=UPI0027E25AC4|nr:uncharacterized protein LOC106087001 [Stomoxys calcitrans]
MAMSLMHLTFGKSSFKFTNIKCKDHDIDFAHFDRCKLLVIGRGVVSLDIKVDLYKTPVSNVSEAFEIKNFLLNEESFRLLPIPEGDYLFKMHVFAYNDLKATVEVYFNRKDGLLF